MLEGSRCQSQMGCFVTLKLNRAVGYRKVNQLFLLSEMCPRFIIFTKGLPLRGDAHFPSMLLHSQTALHCQVQ